MNYFQLFGIEASFDIDLQNISSSYQALQKAVHPDKFAHASEQEQRIAVQKSAHINDAYQTLKQPLLRAEYILVQRGVDMPNEQNTFGDTSFLMRQMELREMLEDVRSAGDVDAALLEVQRILSSEYLQLTQLMRAQISENNSASNGAACDNLRKLKFYQKLNVEVDRLEDALFDDE
ncbi:MAG: co-chaperone HscB [Colwellia sp.]|uniref:co-chaperone HscB n=1 Tax=Colwellia sp. TaxID=56799 RepID=UPI0025B9C7E3|nr:co-chaperone HscB [Colwellia sp.]NQZ26490.1 co-chaperone HscB [Colwellia sp.]